MLIKHTTILLIFFMLVFGCKHQSSKINNDFNTYLKKLKLNKKRNHLYIMISTRSCHSCVNKVIKKVNQYASKGNTTFILSGYSKKYFNHITKKLKVTVDIVYDLKETKFAIQHLTASKTVIYYTKNKENIFKKFDYSEIEEALFLIEKFYKN